MISLIDGDLVAYRSAASCEPTKAKPFLEPLEVAMYRLHDMVQTIIKGTNSNDMEFYIGGENNFRKQLYPEYKANRTKPPPTWLQECREMLVVQYGATVVNGMETDDALGIAQTKYDGNSRIVSIDKDLLQVPGYHFNWVKNEHTLVSPLDGLRTFYKQAICGDGTDNIPSFDGKIRNSTPKFIEKLQLPIESMDNELSMFDYVSSLYEDQEVLIRNLNLLYILRQEDMYWTCPKLNSI